MARGDYNWLTPDLVPLYRDYLPEDLEPLLRECGIDGTIAVQAADSEAESHYLLSLADRNDWILGVVGWVDLEGPNAATSIERLARHPKLVGLRPMIQDIEDDAWMLRDDLQPAVAAMVANNLTFDALVRPPHLVHLKKFQERYPTLTVVIDHCAKPEFRNGAFEPWAKEMGDIARSPNVLCKISGLVTEGGQDWQADDLEPYVQHIINAFGADRLMFGSDWPVVNLASSYRQWSATFEILLTNSRQKINPSDLSENVLRAYSRLRLPGDAGKSLGT